MENPTMQGVCGDRLRRLLTSQIQDNGFVLCSKQMLIAMKQFLNETLEINRTFQNDN